MKSAYLIIGFIIISLLGGVFIYSRSSNNPNPAEITQDSKAVAENSTQYVDFSQDALENSRNGKQVIFFHAKWCPTCKAANEAFQERYGDIPSDVVILKADYDTEKELKQKYGITYQHTFVQIDNEGNELAKWNGGDIENLLNNLQDEI